MTKSNFLSTMESPYHVDDFIINSTRIGPKYFKKIGVTVAPKAPTGLRIK